MLEKYDKDKMVDWVIYKITSPTGRVYIGKTSNFGKRIIHYSKILCNNQHIIKNSLNKYGFNAHTVEIIDEFNSNNNYANGKEMFWIRTCMSNYSKWPEMLGMNLTDGGQGTIGRKNTKEQSIAQSIRRKNNPVNRNWEGHTEESKEKIRLARQIELSNPNYVSPKRGVKMSDESKRKLSEINRGKKGYWDGKKFSKEHLENMSKCRIGIPSPLKGTKANIESVLKMINTKQKYGIKIVQIDLNGNLIDEYSSLGDAVRKTGVPKSTIYNLLKQTKKPRTLFRFEYKK